MLKLLLIEDNNLSRKIMNYYLQNRFEVTNAGTGEEALTIFKSMQFDIILMDLMLPGMDGYETSREIRKIEMNLNRSNFTPIIALTAQVYDNDREKCLASGMNEFMIKPFNLNKLYEILMSLKLMKGNQ